MALAATLRKGEKGINVGDEVSYATVVNEVVYTAECFDGLRDHVLDAAIITDIHLDR